MAQGLVNLEKGRGKAAAVQAKLARITAEKKRKSKIWDIGGPESASIQPLLQYWTQMGER